MSQEQQHKGWRKKLEESEAPMDVQQFWDKLEPQLPPQKKRRILAWWIWPAGLLIGIGMAAAFYWVNVRKTQPEGESFRIEKYRQGMNPSSEIATGSPEVYSELSTLENERQGEVITSEQEEMNNIRTAKSQDNIHGLKSANFGGQVSSDQYPLHVKENVKLNAVAENMQDRSQDQRAPSLITKAATEEIRLNGVMNARTSEVDLLSKTEIDLLVIQPASYLPDFVNIQPGPLPSAWTWAISLAGGPGVGFRQLTSADPGNSSWIDQRNREETVLESWQFRSMIDVMHPSGWLLETGLQWTRQNERLDWSRDSMNWAWGLGEGLLVDPGGGKQPWSDTTWQSHTLTRTVRHYNRISTLDIPLGVGYQISRGRWSVRVSFGALFNLRQFASGRSIHEEQWPVYWGDPFGPKLKTKLGIGAYGNAQLSYQLQNKMSAFIQPSFAFYPDDRQVGSTYSLKYNQANLLVGLRWNLN